MGDERIAEGGSTVEDNDIKCIFFSEFHPTAGPKIVHQFPEDYVSREHFDSVHRYIITKTQLQRRVITINAVKHKIVGCPVGIEGSKYQRNALMFNLCLVFDANQNTSHYESVVKKLAGYLTALETEAGFLSSESTREKLPGLLQEIFLRLNESGSCCVPVNASTTIHLKVVPPRTEPGMVEEYSVPIICTKHPVNSSDWDLATKQLFPYIDGFRHVAKIAAEADVDVNIVKVCIQNLVYYGVIKIISIFQYTNVYVTTAEINTLAGDAALQAECVAYVTRPGKSPVFRDVFAIYCGLRAGTTMRDVCIRYNPYVLGIDERKLVQYGLMKGFIRHLKKYPIKLPHEPGSCRLKKLYKWFNGCYSYDAICCMTGLTGQELDGMVENDQSIVVCWK